MGDKPTQPSLFKKRNPRSHQFGKNLKKEKPRNKILRKYFLKGDRINFQGLSSTFRERNKIYIYICIFLQKKESLIPSNDRHQNGFCLKASARMKRSESTAGFLRT